MSYIRFYLRISWVSSKVSAFTCWCDLKLAVSHKVFDEMPERNLLSSFLTRLVIVLVILGIEALKSMDANNYLKKVGLGRDDMFFWKQVGKALLCTYTIFGMAWIYNETSPLGWWTLKPRPKEERELAHLYERREFPYPGDTEAMEDFVAKGGMIGTAIGPKGIVESEGEADNYQKEMEKKKFDKEAQKLWLRMRNEVITELQEKGHNLE